MYNNNASKRSFAFTLFLEQDERNVDRDRVLREWALLQENGGYRYLICQEERGESTKGSGVYDGRLHLQGYIEFRRTVRRNRCVQLLGGRGVHVGERKFTRDEARNYCRKLEGRMGGPWEYGDWELGGQGARTDAKAVASLIQEGKGLGDIFEADPGYFMRYHGGITRAIGIVGGRIHRTEGQISCRLFWGPTGTGKSHKAHAEMPNAYVWDGSKWWDNYDGQTDVIVDDFGDEGELKEMPSLSRLLKILDKWKYQAQVKGGYAWLKATRFIFTSNMPIEAWYPGVREERKESLRRRFTEVIHMDERFVIPSPEQQCLEMLL